MQQPAMSSERMLSPVVALDDQGTLLADRVCDSVKTWFENDMKAELVAISTKLDTLLLRCSNTSGSDYNGADRSTSESPVPHAAPIDMELCLPKAAPFHGELRHCHTVPIPNRGFNSACSVSSAHDLPALHHNHDQGLQVSDGQDSESSAVQDGDDDVFLAEDQPTPWVSDLAVPDSTVRFTSKHSNDAASARKKQKGGVQFVSRNSNESQNSQIEHLKGKLVVSEHKESADSFASEESESDDTDNRLFGSEARREAKPRKARQTCQITRQTTGQGLLRRHRFESLWKFLEDPESGSGAKLFSHVMQFFIVSSVLVTLVQTMEQSPVAEIHAARTETCIDILFGLEVLLRFVACPTKVRFFGQFFNQLDVAAAAVIIPRACIGFNLYVLEDGHPMRTFLLCCVPLIRISKTLRRFKTLHLLEKACEETLEALPVLLWTMLVAVHIFATLIFIVEPRDNIPSLPRAMWLTIVTMTTVGYGDVAPVSLMGTAVTAVVIVVSVLYMAMPLGIIGQTFGNIWRDRDRILLMQATRKKLMQWGYVAADIPTIFELFDTDGSGEVELAEFLEMMRQMGLGLGDDKVIELFQFLDIDCGGGIDDREFVRQVFPDTFHKLYVIDTTPIIRRCDTGPLGLSSNPLCDYAPAGGDVSHSSCERQESGSTTCSLASEPKTARATQDSIVASQGSVSFASSRGTVVSGRGTLQGSVSFASSRGTVVSGRGTLIGSDRGTLQSNRGSMLTLQSNRGSMFSQPRASNASNLSRKSLYQRTDVHANGLSPAAREAFKKRFEERRSVPPPPHVRQSIFEKMLRRNDTSPPGMLSKAKTAAAGPQPSEGTRGSTDSAASSSSVWTTCSSTSMASSQLAPPALAVVPEPHGDPPVAMPSTEPQRSIAWT